MKTPFPSLSSLTTFLCWGCNVPAKRLPKLTGMVVLIAGLLLAGLSSTAGEAKRTQQFQLSAGWNAIYLDVDPEDEEVGAVFDTQLVDVVARYFVPLTPVRFIESSEEEPWNSAGWSVWYSPRRAESFLSSLHAAHGGAAYLVHAVKAGTLSVQGGARLRQSQWKTDSFNLTGFPIDAPGMTFAQYFAGAANRIGTRVYRLNNGSWQKVTNLATTQIRPGEACWVYCDGSTHYTGPLELRMGGSSIVHFNDQTSVVTVDLFNRVNASFSVTVSIEANDGLPLHRQAVNLAQLSVESIPLTALAPLGNLSPGESKSFRLELRHEFLNPNAGSGSAILKFAASNGIVVRVPIRYRPN